jgi:hypothetical protein
MIAIPETVPLLPELNDHSKMRRLAAGPNVG